MHYILTLILISSFLFAKSSGFPLVIKEPYGNALFDVTQDYDREISAVGFIKHYKKSSSNSQKSYSNAFDYLSSIQPSYGSQMHLIKVDGNANITLRKTVNLNEFNEAVSILKTPTNGYFAGGHSQDGSLLLLKLDSEGNIVFKESFGTSQYDKMSKLVALRDGGVLAVCSSATSKSPNENPFGTGLGSIDIYLVRFSSDGSKVWSNKYGGGYDDIGIDAAETNDGTIVVLSQIKRTGSSSASIMRISQNGDKIWMQSFGGEKMVTPYKILKLRENKFVISLTQKNEINKEQIRLIKFDIEKNIEIDKVIDSVYDSVLMDIKEYSDSNIIGVGYTRDKSDTDALAMAFNRDFRVLHQEHYGNSNYDKFNAVSILHNSQAIAVGVQTDNSSQEGNMWMVKLGKNLKAPQSSALVVKKRVIVKKATTKRKIKKKCKCC
ncbi:hypothetical protein [Sulfurimonas sp.]|uniref:hypothetical protein n=1 Tax=Sulfurimonas sp. TaxID=2022749 RepID=UPI0025ED473B|nr:hypothetical protein [Sulfurimonas sp.]MDD5157248.1 hypothetical protein [Sulfurimonas sp.]